MHFHADEMTDAVGVVLVVAAGIAQHLHRQIVQLPPGNSRAYPRDDCLLNVEDNLVVAPLLVGERPVDRHVALYVGGMVVECRTGVDMDPAARLDETGARAWHERDVALGDVPGFPAARRAEGPHGGGEPQDGATIAVDEIHSFHRLQLGHPRVDGTEALDDALLGDRDGAAQAGQAVGVVKHANPVENAGRVAQLHFR